MTTDKPIILNRECRAVMVPSGEALVLAAGSTVWLTQALGGSYTVMTDRGYTARIDGRDGDALGSFLAEGQAPKLETEGSSGSSVQEQVWHQLRSCFDPEIPVNIVDLGLIYGCRVGELPEGGYRAAVRFTLTAQGCGMGEFLKEDIRQKLLSVPAVHEVEVELVWDPPWNQSMISTTAKHQLGIE
jgi:probable FeS assembly SUF system protein SufT